MKNQMIAGIPQYAFVNAQITQEISTLPAVRENARRVLHPYGLQSWELINPAYVASLLYCLIVVSRHLFVADRVEEEFWNKQVPAEHMCSYFEIKQASSKERQMSSQFLRRLRNSIAHVRYDIVTEQGTTMMIPFSGDWKQAYFVFRDGRSDIEIDFEVITSSNMIMKFLSEVGAKLANLRTASAPMQ